MRPSGAQRYAMRRVLLTALAGCCALPWWIVWLQWYRLPGESLWLCHGAATALLVLAARTAQQQALWLDAQRALLFAALPGWNWFFWLAYAVATTDPDRAVAPHLADDPWHQPIPPSRCPNPPSEHALHTAVDFLSLAEIFFAGHHPMIHQAIDRMVQLRTPEVMALLHSQRQHRDPDIRLAVLSGLARLHQGFESAIDAARLSLQSAPTSGSATAALGAALLAYAHSHLPEPTLQQQLYDDAATHLTTAHARTPNDPRPLWDLWRIAWARNDWAAAEVHLAALEHLPQRDTLQLLDARCTLALAHGDAAVIRETLAHIPSDAPAPWPQVQLWWRGR